MANDYKILIRNSIVDQMLLDQLNGANTGDTFVGIQKV